MIDEQTPVLIGVAQATLRDLDPRDAQSPPELLEQTARAAVADAGGPDRALSDLDTIALAPPVGWRTPNPPRVLAERLGARPAQELLLALGGEMPFTYLDHVAGEIAAGRARSALIAAPTTSGRCGELARRGSGSTGLTRRPGPRRPSERRLRGPPTMRSATASTAPRRSTRSSKTRCARVAGSTWSRIGSGSAV